ncbi:MAG: MerR family DNA-binding transcriptional regulator [Longimicrobiales bacterium]
MSDPGTASEMLIGELAEASGVGVETLRFYEREGLLPEPPRSEAGYRLYGRDAVRRIQFILKAKELGFTLAETGELLALRVMDTAACDDVAAKARAKIKVIESRMRELGRVRRALDDLIAACAANEETGECPILEALEPESEPPADGA